MIERFLGAFRDPTRQIDGSNNGFNKDFVGAFLYVLLNIPFDKVIGFLDQQVPPNQQQKIIQLLRSGGIDNASCFVGENNPQEVCIIKYLQQRYNNVVIK